MAEEITSQLKKNLLDEENGTSSHVVEGAADADAATWCDGGRRKETCSFRVPL